MVVDLRNKKNFIQINFPLYIAHTKDSSRTRIRVRVFRIYTTRDSKTRVMVYSSMSQKLAKLIEISWKFYR